MGYVEIIQLVIIPVGFAILGYFFNRRLQYIDQNNEIHQQQMKEAIKKENDELERRHKSRIQFEMQTNFIGMQKGHWITEFIITLENLGFTRYKTDAIGLKVKGIISDAEIVLIKKNYQTKYVDSIIKFPESLIETNILARTIKDENMTIKEAEKVEHFLEPSVIQQFTYVARIPENIKFLLVRASFKYHKKSEHTIKRVFEVKINNHDL